MADRKHGRPSLETRKAAINQAWERIEASDPDISTEQLIARVADETGEEYGDVASLVDTLEERAP
jgi:hypothetical protein